MTLDDFRRQLAETVQVTPPAGLAAVMERLSAVAGALGGSFAPADVHLESGWTTNYGKQYKVVVSLPAMHLEETLLKVYVPVTGFPVMLDLYDEQPSEAADLEALDRAILSFLSRSDTRTRLGALQELARQQRS